MSEHAPNADREWSGRFKAGNSVKGGRLPRATEAQRLDTLRSVVTDEKWRKVCEQALRDALNLKNWRVRDKGRRFIAEYLIGKPAQTITVKAGAPENPYSEYDDIPDDELRQIAAADGGQGDSGNPSVATSSDSAAGAGTPAPD
jgi:hypothetical protein